MSKNLAPVALFVYNRLRHTQQTVEALTKNNLAQETLLFIFSDGPKKDTINQVQEVRNYLKTISGFKQVYITEHTNNLGLAKNVINGVSKIISKYGKIIVLEDDLVTSPFFLNFMNQALDIYKNEKKVWNINGYMFPLKGVKTSDTFFWRAPSPWGWATWDDRWKFFEKKPKKLIEEFSKNDIYQFNIEDCEVDYWKQVVCNDLDIISTWSIFWYATIFRNKGLCLSPTISYVTNIGFDASGVHCGNKDNFYNSSTINLKSSVNIESKIIENKKYLRKIKIFLRRKDKSYNEIIGSKTPRLVVRIINKLSRVLTNKNILIKEN